MSRKSLLVFSFLFFSAPLLAAEVLDFALVFKSLIQDKSLISGYRRTVFNQNIDLIGRVDPFLIPVYLEILNLPDSDQKARKLTRLNDRISFMSSRFNQHLDDLSLLAGKDSSLDDKTFKKVQNLLGEMRIQINSSSDPDTSVFSLESGDFFPVYLYLTGKPGLSRLPDADYRSLVGSLSLQAAKNLVDLLRIATELKSIRAEDIAYTYQINWAWTEHHKLKVILPAAAFYRALAASLNPAPRAQPNE